MSDLTKYFIVGTAGHVDHGKSSLVRALTGIDPDRLPEEKARGITIDLGFAHLELKAGSQIYVAGMIDVPGHEDFVKNMVAGVGAVDLGLLAVAADDGWMPQTEEHTQILAWLGVRSVVVALTKADLLPERLDEREDELRRHLADTPFAQAPIVRTSVLSGQGLDDLRAALASALALLPMPRDLAKPRLPVDRVFSLQGIGTVVTGTLSGGCIEQGQKVFIQPGNTTSRVRSIQCYGNDVTDSGPGRRTALNLVDLPGPDAVKRGNVITTESCFQPSQIADVILFGPAHPANSTTHRPSAVKSGARLRVHHGSANVPARLFLLEQTQWDRTAPILAELRLEAPLLMFGRDRLVLRDWGEQMTVAGGVVLDPSARLRRFRTAEQRYVLTQRAAALDDAAVWVETEVKRDRMMPALGFLRQTLFGDEELAAAASKLVQARRIYQVGTWWAEATWWEGLQQQAAATVDGFHRDHPELPGIPLTELFAQVKLPSHECLELLIGSLLGRGYIRRGAVLQNRLHRPALPAHLQGEGNRIRAALGAKPLEPPARKELTAGPAGEQALRFLQEAGEVVSLNEEVVILAESYARVEAQIIAFLKTAGTATVSGLRQHIGTTRRILVPLLERMDRVGITQRQGDGRVLRQQAQRANPP